jgi:SRSO17 transposase
MQTYTPELDPVVLDRLRDYAALFADDFPQARPALWAGVYLQGLLLDGERKSIEPLSRRVDLPPGLTVRDPDQALQPFVNQSPWDERRVLRRYRSVLAKTFASPEGIFVFDEVSFPKQGRCSVGVPRPYCGALGKKANGQVAVSVHSVSPRGHYPLDLRLYLPESGLAEKRRLDRAGIPEEQRRAMTKPPIALELLDGVRAEGLPGRRVVADAGDGVSGAFRDGWEARGLSYVGGVTREFMVFTRTPRGRMPEPVGPAGGRPRARPRLAEGRPRPVALGELAKRVRLRRVTGRDGTKGRRAGRFAWLRVWPGTGWQTGRCVGAGPVWRRIEEQADGAIPYALRNLPPRTSARKAVRLWKSRWPVEQGYQQMKEELGLDHFEGRSWRGFHHHAAMVMLAYGFLLRERHRGQEHPVRPGKKGVPSRC